MSRCLTLSVIIPVFVASATLAAGPARISAEHVRQWIDQLDHDDFAVREKAAAHLAHAGHAAIAPLAEGVISPNPEVAWRASETLERMAMEGDEATMDQVVSVLGDLAKRGKPGLAQFASQMRERQRVFRHNRAAAELRKLGANVSGGQQTVDDLGLSDLDAEGVMDALPDIEVAVEEDVAVPADEPDAPEGAVEPADPPEEKEARLGEARPDFRLPALDKADDDVEDGIAIEAMPALEIDIDEPAIEVVPAFAPAAMPIFIGGMGGMIMSGDEGVPGYMALTREWRGGDAALKHLKDLSGIANLQIDHAEITDAALPHIAKLTTLKHLQIRGGKFSREALRTFHRQRAEVNIMAMGDGMMGVMGQFTADGCTLDQVFPGSAAADAGLQVGDKVTMIAGDPVNDFSDLTISVSTRKAGDKLKTVFVREGKEHEVEMTLKPRPPGQ
jgi:hypothetical protein